MSVIVAQDIELELSGQRVLSRMSLDIPQGQFLAIVGPSGCGKTSLLRIAAGLIAPTGGRWLMSGANVASVGQHGARPRRAYVFQDPTLLPWRSALANVKLPLELAGVGRADAEAAARAALGGVGLASDDLKKTPRMLSGGMRMRVSLARALVTGPDLLLLDEPFAALDDLLRQRLNEELLALWQQQQWTALFVTHNVAEAIFLSQRVLVLSRRPATIAADISVPLPHPRTAAMRATPEFARLCGQVSEQLGAAS